jgi:hypothetical protein
MPITNENTNLKDLNISLEVLLFYVIVHMNDIIIHSFLAIVKALLLRMIFLDINTIENSTLLWSTGGLCFCKNQRDLKKILLLMNSLP